MKAHFMRLMRYGFLGITVNVAGYLVYLALTWLGLGPKTTMTLLYGIGATLGYLGNRHFTFGYRGSYGWSVLRYGVIHLAGFGLNFALLFVFVDLLGYPHQIVQAAAIFGVAAFLFLAFTFFVFPQSKDAPSASLNIQGKSADSGIEASGT